MLVVDGIVFEDAPSEIEGAPYWVDLWSDVNGYKIGLQVKPVSYQSASTSLYSRGAKSSESNGQKSFTRKFGGKVFVVMPQNGMLPANQVKQIKDEYNLLKQMKKRQV